MRLMLTPCLGAMLVLNSLGLAPASRADEAPRVKPAAEFELRTLSVGPKVYLLRFKSATGEAWVSTGAKWTAVGDDPAPGAGVYDVMMAPTEIGYTAVRIERRSGSAWMLRDGKWKEIQEPEERPAK